MEEVWKDQIEWDFLEGIVLKERGEKKMELEVMKKIGKRMENLVKELSTMGEENITSEILKKSLSTTLINLELVKKGMLEALEELEEID